MEARHARPRPGPRAAYLFMLALCFYALIALAAERFIPLPADFQGLIQEVDFGVCLIFFVDFVMSLVTAPRRWRYFVTWGWIDLLSSIPTIEAFRIGRAARVMRIFRALRGVRATKLIATFVLERRAEGAFLAAALVTLLLLLFASASVLHVENLLDSNIKGPEDALWWAFVTITTVGYGDRFPVSSEGRLAGALLLRREVAEMRATLERLAGGRRVRVPPRPARPRPCRRRPADDPRGLSAARSS